MSEVVFELLHISKLPNPDLELEHWRRGRINRTVRDRKFYMHAVPVVENSNRSVIR